MSDNSAELMATYVGLVRALAWKFHQRLPRSVELDDLVGYGCVGLAEAAQAYDRERGLKFSTYAYHRIRGAILDGLSQMSWFRIDKFAAGEYEPRPQGEPRTEQTAAAAQTLGAPGNIGNYARRMSERLMRGAAEPLAAGDAVDRGPSGEHTALRTERDARLRQMIEALPAAAAELLIATYYEGLSLTDAAQRMGRNKSWASRLHAKALAKLALALKAEGLA